MKNLFSCGNKFFLFCLIAGFLMLLIGACGAGNGAPPNSPVLFGATSYTANASNTSYLYQVSTTDGTTTLIGDIGFKVNSMAYDAVTKKLYGITEDETPQLISIDMTTGAGTLIADITVQGYSTIINVNNGWNGNYVSSIGATGTSFYAQSFIANVNMITKFGVVIYQVAAEGQLILGIAADNGANAPNVSAPLYEGALRTPSTTGAWFYEEGINVPVTTGQKYWVLIDGYNNAGATGRSSIGLSSNYTSTGEGMIFSNGAGENWTSLSGSPLAIYVEGELSLNNLTFNSAGQLFAWNNTDNSLCSINITTGAATCTVASGVTAANAGLAFNNSDVLYLVNGDGNVYTMDTATATATSAGTVSGLPYNMAYHGDFNPSTGVYWGLDTTSGTTRNLLVIDMSTFTLSQTISTLDSMYALAFGYK